MNLIDEPARMRANTLQAEVATYLRRNGARYFGSEQDTHVNVELIAELPRPGSTLFRYRLTTASSERLLLVKSSGVEKRGGADGAVDAQRPRIVDPAPSMMRFVLEHRALGLIRSHFSNLDDPRFAAVDVHDVLPEQRSFVMQHVKARSLRDMVGLSWQHWSPGMRAEVFAAFRNAGAWLRIFHSLEQPEPLTTVQSAPSDVVALIYRYSEYLTSVLGHAELFRKQSRVLADSANRILPNSLPTGLRHGDFAMRNVLVQDSGAVSVIDTLANCRAPIYLDIATFLTDLKFRFPHLLLGRASMRTSRCETEFLLGYFQHGAVPLDVIRLYEQIALLDRWAALASYRQRERPLVRRWSQQLRHALLFHFFRKGPRIPA